MAKNNMILTIIAIITNLLIQVSSPKALISQEKNSLNSDWDCVKIIQEASDLRAQKNYQASLYLLDSAEACINGKQIDYNYNYAHICQIRSQNLINLDDIEAAKVECKIGIRTLVNKHYDSLLAKLYNGLGNCFWYTNSFDSALTYYTLALQTSLGDNQDKNLESASYYQNIGLVHIYKGDYEKAEEFLLKSIEVKKEILGDDDPSLARNYLNLGVLFTSMSKLDKAFEYYDLAEDLYLRDLNKYSYELGNLYWNKGNGYITVGDYENAEYYLNKALSVFQEYSNISSENIAQILMNLGFVYEKTDRNELAIEYYNNSLTEKDSPSKIKTLRNLAIIYAKSGDFKTAEEYFEKSIHGARKLFGDYSQDIGLSYLYYGEALISNGYLEKGLQYLNNALQVFHEIFGKYNRDVSSTLLKIGDYYLNNGDFQSAIAYYQKSISSIVRDTMNQQNPSINPSLDLIPSDLIALEALSKKANALYLKGLNDNSIGDFSSSLETYDLVVIIIDQLKDLYTTEESKLILSNKAKDAYNRMIKANLKVFESTKDSAFLEKAFNLSERSKSSVLLASINDVEAKIKGQIPEEFLEKEKSIKQDLGTYNRLLYEENQKRSPSQAKLNLWRSKVFALKTSHDSLINYFEKKYSSYYNLKYERDYVEYTEIQALLKDDQAVVEYVMMDTCYYSFIITHEDISLLYKTIDSSVFNAHVRNIISSSRSFAPINFDTADYRTYVNSSYELYKMLWLDIDKKAYNKRVLIVPDGNLSYLPFDILISNKVSDYSNIDFKNADFLIKNHSFSYSSSATLYFKQIKSNQPHNNKVLAIAPSYDSFSSTNPSSDDTIRASLLPLYHTKTEVKSILNTFRGQSFFDDKATEDVFYDRAPSYDIIHLAMHTIINDKDPMYSKLVFYPDSTTNYDGYLNTYEIYNLNLDGQLAVLSACNTGFGKLERGEGVMNMARAFMFAGIPGVVMTLWTVEDKSGAVIMDDFYKNLSIGNARDIALQKAKLKYLNNASNLFSHPYYWAAYVNMGTIEPIEHGENSNKWLTASLAVLFGIFIAITTIILIIRYRKGQHRKAQLTH